MEKQPNRTAAKKIFHVVGLLALALVSVYIIVQCFVIFHRSYKTETAIKYTLAESITLDGVVAFDSVDVAGSGDLGYLVQDGERVTNGTVVAEVYTDDSQGLQRERLDRLERTITLLTKSQNSTGSDLSVLTNQTKQGSIQRHYRRRGYLPAGAEPSAGQHRPDGGLCRYHRGFTG